VPRQSKMILPMPDPIARAPLSISAVPGRWRLAPVELDLASSSGRSGAISSASSSTDGHGGKGAMAYLSVTLGCSPLPEEPAVSVFALNACGPVRSASPRSTLLRDRPRKPARR